VTNTIRTMRALALTLAATAAVVSACGGSSSGPRTAPPVSTSPASVSSPTPAAAAVPAAAKAATSTGAEAFARFFYTQVVRAFAAKNPALIASISAPGCTACESYIRSLTKLRDNNERVEHFSIKVISVVAPAVTGASARADVSWSQPDVAVRYDASGKEIFRDGPYRRVDTQLNLLRQGDGWLVSEIKPIRTEK
jgi:hypothetical protein